MLGGCNLFLWWMDYSDYYLEGVKTDIDINFSENKSWAAYSAWMKYLNKAVFSKHEVWDYPFTSDCFFSSFFFHSKK